MEIFKEKRFMNSLIEIFPKLTQLFPKTISVLVKTGLILVYFYHLFCNSSYFNMAFHEAIPIEKVANTFLAPLHYLCNGKVIYYNKDLNTYTIKNRFQYKKHELFKISFAANAIVPSIVIGSTLKASAFLFSEVRVRHQKLKKYLKSPVICSNKDYYRLLGIHIKDFETAPYIQSQNQERRPGDAKHLSLDKKALFAISKLLKKHQIPFWVDCGTCLGAYRYGGIIPWDHDIDLAVIVDDFDNVMNALKGLDKHKYVVQDWSGRSRPKTYIRVYVKETRNHIDIYHNKIDPVAKTLTNILSYEESLFLPESWKIRERMFGKPVPFEDVFPLKKAFFDGMELPVPGDIEKYLKSKYGPDLSPVRVYNKEKDAYEKNLAHPYWGIPLVD